MGCLWCSGCHVFTFVYMLLAITLSTSANRRFDLNLRTTPRRSFSKNWCPWHLPQLKRPGARMQTATYWAHPVVYLSSTPGQRLPQSSLLGSWPVLWCPWRLPQLKGPGARMRTATYSSLAHPAVPLAPTPWPASTAIMLTWGMACPVLSQASTTT